MQGLDIKYLTSDSDKTVNFECCVCMDPIDIDSACECLECEVAICKKDYESIAGKH